MFSQSKEIENLRLPYNIASFKVGTQNEFRFNIKLSFVEFFIIFCHLCTKSKSKFEMNYQKNVLLFLFI